ncbi:MAG: hypothetical protein CM1200mP9_01740 [Gammaproteobacteria bacterium]|nr:MAG: hypothetical protein CM1200mP9_01740 [Gammaproteobacteria bacterium]
MARFGGHSRLHAETPKIDDVNGLQADPLIDGWYRCWGVLAKKTRVWVWGEILHPNLPDNVVIQCWRGMFGRDEALQAG